MICENFLTTWQQPTLLCKCKKESQLTQGLHATAAILDFIEPQIAPFDLPTLKTITRTKHGVDRMHYLRDIRF